MISLLMINDDSLVGLKMLKSQPSRVINAAKSPGDFTSGWSIWVCVCVCVCVCVPLPLLVRVRGD